MRKVFLIATACVATLIGSMAGASQEEAGVTAGNPSASPTGAEVVFEGSLELSDLGGPALWVVSTTSSTLRKLTQGSEGDREPAWSPDGRTIAFSSTRGGATDIWSIAPDGSRLVQLTRNSFYNRDPTWSPDGSRIAFVSNRAGSNDIWVMNADGSGQRRVTRLPGEKNHPSFSPAGDQIVFSMTYVGRAALVVINLDGTNSRPLTSGPFNDWRPHWSSSFGILFSSNRDREAGHYQPWLIQPDGTGLRKATEAFAVDPVFLPSGSILFGDAYSDLLSDSVLSQIAIVDPVSGVKRNVTTVRGWLPPGDVNNDGRIDCADLFAVRAAFGKGVGQAGFNPRADMNADGVIDINDLASVSRLVPPGTICK